MPLKKKKGKSSGSGKKKKKTSAAEKALAKLEKETDKYKKSEAFWPWVDFIHEWLVHHHGTIISLLARVDASEEGEPRAVDYKEFKSCLLDLYVPASKVELHLLAQLLDEQNTKKVCYENLEDGLNHIRSRREIIPNELRNQAFQAAPKGAPISSLCHQVQYPKYVRVMLRMVTFESVPSHPSHMVRVVPLHVTAYTLCDLLSREAGITSTQIAIFTESSKAEGTRLPLGRTLEDLGFHGGSEENPKDLELFYDFKTDFKHCALLTCDYYFINKKDPKDEAANRQEEEKMNIYGSSSEEEDEDED